jgi:hypothetical protein
MINYQEYLALHEDLQTQLLSVDGICLDLVRSCRNINVELYSLYQFYVEIFFDKATEEPLYLKAFNKMELLDPYLDQVDIAELKEIREGGY